MLAVQVHFGQFDIPPEDPYAGQYIRTSSGQDSAEIVLSPVPDGIEGVPRYFISGFALWGTHREYGPNMGELGIIGVMSKPGTLQAYEPNYKGTTYSIRLSFEGDILRVEEDNASSRYGMNVTFDGLYQKAV